MQEPENRLLTETSKLYRYAKNYKGGLLKNNNKTPQNNNKTVPKQKLRQTKKQSLPLQPMRNLSFEADLQMKLYRWGEIELLCCSHFYMTEWKMLKISNV